MPSTKKTWISIAIAAAIILGMLGLTLVGGMAYYIYRRVHTEFTGPDAAAIEFAQARERFKESGPLIEMRGRDEPLLHRPPESAPTRPPVAVHVLAYNADARKLVRLEIPMWLLRLSPRNARVRLLGDQVDFDSDRPRLTVEDIERHGPGLVLDHRTPTGTQVLVWAE